MTTVKEYCRSCQMQTSSAGAARILVSTDEW
jgi:hypothetical protein